MFGSWTDFVCDFVSGSVAGVAFVLSSQPFDTIKVRMQMAESKQSIFNTIYGIFKKEGFFSFYKGMVPPLLTSLPVSSSLFTSYEYYMRFMQVQNREDMIVKHWIFAGAFAGFVQSFIVCPAEMLKCIMQMQFEYQPKQFRNPYFVFRHIIRRDGLKGIYKGLISTFLRDIPQYAMFFLTFETFKYETLKYTKEQDLNFLQGLLGGALAGVTCIMVSYPQDMVKTKLQIEGGIPQKSRIYKARYYDGGVTECCKQIYRQNGLKVLGFLTGFNSCVVYYIIACSTQFSSYEMSRFYFYKFAGSKKY